VPTKPENRDYKKEAQRESPQRQQDRRDRMKARYDYEKKHGNLPTNIQVDHKRALSAGGTNADSNLRAISKKRNESFNRAGPGGRQIGKAK
jgi:hypothetical protein